MTEVSNKDGLSIRNQIRDFFKQAVEKGIFDAVLMPMLVPAKDSYAWILSKDKNLFEDFNPLAPIMPVNAAKALKRYTRKGKGKFKIAVLMRPCEIRATIELSKLKQINLADIILLSYDCPGALPMQDYISDPEKGEQVFNKILNEKDWNSKDIKPVCQICDKFSNSASDIHFGFDDGKILFISNNEKGSEILKNLEIERSENLNKWEKNIAVVKKQREKNKTESYRTISSMVDGFSNLKETFANCIGCHNCQSSCPICYCRQCYFDTSVSKPNSDLILIRAENKGGLAFPLDRLMFHTGRMSHMSLSCVSCGLCSDACPVNIPVSKIFSYVASKTQKTFDYIAGEDIGDALPMRDYKLDELGELGKLVKSAEPGGETS